MFRMLALVRNDSRQTSRQAGAIQASASDTTCAVCGAGAPGIVATALDRVAAPRTPSATAATSRDVVVMSTGRTGGPRAVLGTVAVRVVTTGLLPIRPAGPSVLDRLGSDLPVQDRTGTLNSRR